MMKRLRGSPRVVKLIKCFESEQQVRIVMELCRGGDLHDRIIQVGVYSERDAAKTCREMLELVNHCHRCGVIHRDIKLENMLLDKEGEDATLKGTDFGLATLIPPDGILEQACGTPWYVAPEVLMRRYGLKADIWSVGVNLYILLSGRPPFYGPNDEEIMRATLMGEYDVESDPWDRISDDAKRVVKKMLEYEPEDRPTAAELLEDDWIREDGTAPAEPLIPTVLKNLRLFTGMNSLKKSALMTMATLMIQDEELQTQTELFKKADKDQNGTISREEVRLALSSIQEIGCVSNETLSLIMQTFDNDRDEQLNFREFLMAVSDMSKHKSKENASRVFHSFDLDGDGQLSFAEVKRAIGSLDADADAIARECILLADPDHRKYVDEEHFIKFLTEETSASVQRKRDFTLPDYTFPER